jgi:hypothetical protein
MPLYRLLNLVDFRQIYSHSNNHAVLISLSPVAESI